RRRRCDRGRWQCGSRRQPAAHPADGRRRASRPVGARPHRHHERPRRQRHLERAAMGGRPAGRQPAVSAGRGTGRRAIGGGRARRSRAQPAGNRQQPREDQRRRSRADPAADRRGGASLQSAGDGRRAAAARADAGALDPADPNTESQLTIMMHRILFTLFVLAGLVAGAAQAAAAAPARPDFDVALIVDQRDDDRDDRAEELYDDGREAIEEGRFDRAVDRFNRLIEMKTNRTDAALYWKAYSQSKLGQRAEALATLTDLQKRFADSRWSRDAKALEVEVRQASGQPVSAASQDDDELKLYALRGVMQTDPEQAFPILEKMLAGANSPRVKDRALFVLSQSRNSRARDVIAGIAKGNANPDLQQRAIRYLGIMGGAENRQVLADVYRGSSDVALKRSILRSF